MTRLMAGIVLFNPEIDRLNENLSAISPQVEKVALIDNGSSNLAEIEKLIRQFPNTELVRNTHNGGIAKALNQIIEFAAQHDYLWALTLDQDSVCREGLMDAYSKYLTQPNVAMMTCEIEDRNFKLEKEEKMETPFVYIDKCITSACLTNVAASKAVGGFDETMFIDSVDFDFCAMLRKNGYQIIKVNYPGLLHEVGHTKTVRFLHLELEVHNHSPFRTYYIIRNKIYMMRKHKDYLNIKNETINLCLSIYLVLIYENQKLTKLRKIIKGLIDGFKMPINHNRNI